MKPNNPYKPIRCYLLVSGEQEYTIFDKSVEGALRQFDNLPSVGDTGPWRVDYIAEQKRNPCTG